MQAGFRELKSPGPFGMLRDFGLSFEKDRGKCSVRRR